MRAIAAGLSDVGKQRVHNEDRFILLPEFSVFVVADGMGGHQSGEVASRMAASTHRALLPRRDGGEREPVGERLRAAVTQANARIFARADDSRATAAWAPPSSPPRSPATTRELYVAHAGDSRCYRLRDGQLEQLTRDHSLVSDALLERPDLSEQPISPTSRRT